MAHLHVRHLTVRTAKGGAVRHFWQPTTRLRAAGWKLVRLADDLPLAMTQAEEWNAKVDAWRRTGERWAPGAAPADRRALRGAPPPGSVGALLQAYRDSPRFKAVAAKTAKDYEKALARIEAELGRATTARAVTRPVAHKLYERLIDRHGVHWANAIMRVARIAFGYGHDTGLVAANPFEKPRLVGVEARLRIATFAELDALVAAADVLDLPSIGDAVLFGAYVGQREGDLLLFPRLRAAGERIRLRQSKTGTPIDVRMTPRLHARLQATLARLEQWQVAAPELIVAEATGRRYKADHFRHTFAEVRAAAALACPTVTDLRFQDLRDTAVTNLASASCTIPEIAAITGHSEKTVYSILRHYLALNGEMADNAIAKLVNWEEGARAEQAAANGSGPKV